MKRFREDSRCISMQIDVFNSWLLRRFCLVLELETKRYRGRWCQGGREMLNITQNWIRWSTIHLKLSSKKVCVFRWSASSVAKRPGKVVGSTWKPCMPALMRPMRESTACAAPGLELPCLPRRQLANNHRKFLVQLQLPRYYNCKFMTYILTTNWLNLINLLNSLWIF